MTRLTSVLPAALVLVLAACENTTLGITRGSGSGDARIQVSVLGDNPPLSLSVRRADGGGPAFNHTAAQGTIEFRARVYVQSTARGWVELTGNAARSGTVSASGHGDPLAFVSSRVNTESYDRVRIIFQEVEANLTAGSGLLTGNVSVDMDSDGQVVVEREVSISASTAATTQLLINLNADAWLSQASTATRTVGEAAFQAAVQVAVQ